MTRSLNVRQTSIDYMKALLVIGMIMAHSLQLLSKPNGLFWLFSTGINLITFSGFFFCFGYVFYPSYLAKPFAEVKRKMLKTAWKALLGYYIAALSALLILSPAFSGAPYQLSANRLFRLITFAEVPWFTEFLLTFFLITALVLIFFSVFQSLANSLLLTLCVSGGCWLLAILLPGDLRLNGLLGLLVGTRTNYIFPVVQYLPIFLFGLYFSRHGIVWNRLVFLLATSGTALFTGYYVRYREMPLEFLPSIYWLVGSYGIVYGYFLVTKWLESQTIVFYGLLSIGRNTLLYLILSNLILFSIRNSLQLEPIIALLIGVIVIFVIGFLLSLVNQTRRVPTGDKADPKSLWLER